MIRRATIRSIAESQGIGELSDSVADALASEVEYRLRQVVEFAVKSMNHAHHTVLSAEDINAALRQKNVEGLYGYGASEEVVFRQVEGYDDLFYLDDCEEKLVDILQEPIPEGPVDPTFTLHWLAVEGVQPRLPQNPSQSTAGPGGAAMTGRSTAEASSKSAEPIVRTTVKHVLSKEQQMLYQHVCAGIKSGDVSVQRAVLQCLSSDVGLHQLLPYFTQFIADEVNSNLRNLPLLKQLMKMAHALLISPHLCIEPYLHQLMPSILTCLVGRALCMNASEDHWGLRDYAARLVAVTCSKFGHTYHTLQPRITKTLAKAFLDPERPLTTHYGAIVGLSALGHHVVRSLILPHGMLYLTLLEPAMANRDNPVKRMEARMCYGAMLCALGLFIRQSLQDEYLVMFSPGGDPLATGDLPSTPSSINAGAMTLTMDGILDFFGEALHPFVQPSTSYCAEIFL